MEKQESKYRQTVTRLCEAYPSIAYHTGDRNPDGSQVTFEFFATRKGLLILVAKWKDSIGPEWWDVFRSIDDSNLVADFDKALEELLK